jgi:hypothetical protein
MTGPYPPPQPQQQPPGYPYPVQPQYPMGYPPPPPPPPPKKSMKGTYIGLFIGALVLAIACGGTITGVLIYRNNQKEGGGGTGDENKLAAVIDYRTTHPEWLKQDHKEGFIVYPMNPPAGGPHHPVWQNCMGDVYDKPIDNGNAVHSLEHGAVWITYQPATEASTVSQLESRITGREYTMMSPYPGQPTMISVQAWGYQLGLTGLDLDAVDAFIDKYRIKATVETGAACSGGETSTT